MVESFTLTEGNGSFGESTELVESQRALKTLVYWTFTRSRSCFDCKQQSVIQISAFCKETCLFVVLFFFWKQEFREQGFRPSRRVVQGAAVADSKVSDQHRGQRAMGSTNQSIYKYFHLLSSLKAERDSNGRLCVPARTFQKKRTRPLNLCVCVCYNCIFFLNCYVTRIVNFWFLKRRRFRYSSWPEAFKLIKSFGTSRIQSLDLYK